MPPVVESTFNWVIWLCSESLARAIEYLFPPCAPRHSPSDIDDKTDEEILALRQNSGYKDFSSPNRPRYITRITKDTVLKFSRDVTEDEEAECPSEALALQLVSEQTTIPVPQIRRVVKARDSFIAMEYIPGQQLSVVWPTLSWFGRLRVAFIIRSYVQQLRKIKHPRSSVPGPLAGPSEGGMVCQSPLFGPIIDCRGPFETYADLTNFFNDRLSQTLMSEGSSTSLDSLTTFDNSQPLVFCNQYLNPGNFIVGDDGQLWLADWPFAGFYPPWFEFATMRIQAKYDKQYLHWDAIIPFVCGWYFEQERWLKRIVMSLSWI